MRSAGCVVNDILDRKIDKMVERTKNRPLASGKVSVGLAIIYATILCAIASSFMDKSINENIVFIGEIGLAGEVRSISRLGDRLSEVEALGFNGAIVPEASMNDKMKKSNLKIYPVTSVKQTFDILFWNTQ